MSRPQPMLAYQGKDGLPPSAAELAPHFPLLGSRKKDGIRAVNWGGDLKSRSWLSTRSLFAQKSYGSLVYDGIDGELLCPLSEVWEDMTLFHASQSRANTIDDIRHLEWHVFDIADFSTGISYERRLDMLLRIVDKYPAPLLTVLEQRILRNYDDVLEYEQECVEKYNEEGIIVRRPDASYKAGRSTLRQGALMKFCRWERREAKIIGYAEQQQNTNVAELDNFGRTKRSTAKDGKVGKGVLGAWTVDDERFGVFNIGGGPLLDAASRARFWKTRDQDLGSLLNYRFKPYGVKDKPRFPQAIGIRSREDL